MFKHLTQLGVLCVLTAIARAENLAGGAVQYSIAIDLAIKHQVIDNFGASDCWSMQHIGGWSLENRNRVADLLFSTTNGIGLSCWRFNIGAGKNNEDIRDDWRTVETFEVAEGAYDWSRQAEEQWFLSAAKARGVEQFVAFANSPPARMTRNGLTHCTEDVGTTNLKPGYERQYARYLADIVQHFAEHTDPALRIAFDWVSPVNEPQWDWNGRSQEGNRASNGDLKGIVRALHAALIKRGLDTQILAPESGSLYALRARDFLQSHGAKVGDYFDEFAGAPEFGGLLGNVLCGHAYFIDRVPKLLIPERRKFRRKLDEYPGWRYWMTEYCILQGTDGQGGGGRDLTMNLALDVARVIHYDLTICNASAWQWWTAVSRYNFKDGLIYTDYRQPGDAETIYPAKLLWALGNYSRFIRPGAQRVELRGADYVHGLMGSAYRSAEGDKVTLIFVNMEERPAKVSLALAGFGVTSWTPCVTDRENDLQEYPPVELKTGFTVPSRAVVTLTGTITSTQ